MNCTSCFSVLPSPQVGEAVIECAGIGYFRFPHIGSLKFFPVAQMVKNLSAMQETQVQSLGWDDPLEKGMAPPTPVFLPGEPHGQKSLVG